MRSFSFISGNIIFFIRSNCVGVRFNACGDVFALSTVGNDII